MTKLKKLIIANGILFLFILAFLIYTIFKFNAFLNTPASQNHRGVYIKIEKNEPIKQLIKKLKQKNLITRSDWFYYYIRLTGEAKNIKAGYHFIRRDYTPKQILDELVNPKLHTVKLTILPGYDLKKIEQLMKENGLDYSGFKKLEHNAKFIKECSGYKALSLEGFLYPDSYFVAKEESARVIAKLMCGQFKKVYEETTKRDNFTESDYKKLIIASIIQKEATNVNDMKLVASVIYNRLKRKMPLQMDSTRSIDNKSYNTYLHKGLPPAPICNPERSAIYAAYNPEKSSFLFFISKKNGEMVFSKTLKQHDNNIRKYLR